MVKLKIMYSMDKLPSCNFCQDLTKNRTQVVIGDGELNPDIVFIGEAPGAQEDIRGKPFVGRSGTILRNTLAELNINNYYITNLVKCRPPGNRDPTESESKNCFPYLKLQLKKLNPKIICTLGRHSTSKVLAASGKEMKTITDQRGSEVDIIIDGKKYILFPMYHPAATIYNQKLKKTFISDLKKLSNIASI